MHVDRDDIPVLTGRPADQFICDFESMGRNCEFGLVQRRCNAEPLGLLRFSSINLANLLRGLQTRFEGIGDPKNLEWFLAGGKRKEYQIRDRRFGLSYHTWQRQGEVDEARLIPQHSARLQFLSRKFLEDLAQGEKLFVWKNAGKQAREHDTAAVLDAMAAIGPGRLFWVDLADTQHPAGSVTIDGPMIRGFIERFAPSDNAHDLCMPGWLDLCVQAHRLHSAARATGGVEAPRGIQDISLKHPMHVRLVAHVERRGDLPSGNDGWVGARGSGLAIEGFAVLEEPGVPTDGMRYRAVLADGALSGPGRPGQYRGTRGKRQALLGFCVDMEPGGVIGATCEAAFTDGTAIGPLPAGKVCAAAAGQRLEALRITLIQA